MSFSCPKAPHAADEFQPCSENLSSESFLADIRNGLTEFVERYKADRDILRFHYHDPEKLLAEISDLMGNHKSFKAQKNFNVDI